MSDGELYSDPDSESESESTDEEQSKNEGGPPSPPDSGEIFAFNDPVGVEIRFVDIDGIASRYAIQALTAIDNGLLAYQRSTFDEVRNTKAFLALPDSDELADAFEEYLQSLKGRQLLVTETRSGSVVVCATIVASGLAGFFGFLIGHSVKKGWEQTETHKYIERVTAETAKSAESKTKTLAKSCERKLQRNFRVIGSEVKRQGIATIISFSILTKELSDELNTPTRPAS